MSGPKSFSVHVFDANLKKIFKLQSQINQIFQELQNFFVLDKELSISFDCNDFINKNLDQANKHLKSFELGVKGTVQQAEHDKIKKNIKSKIKSLNKILKNVNDKKKDFLDKRQDYLSYVSYNNYFENAHHSFDQFKTNLTDYLEKNIKNDDPGLFKKSKNQINKVKSSIKKLEFKFGFQDLEEKGKQKVNLHINQNEDKVSEIRNQIAKKKLAESLSQKMDTTTTKIVKENKEIGHLINKINDKLDLVENDKIRKRFKNELVNLRKSEVLTGSYFYKEFLDGMKQSEQNQDFKREIKNLIYEINYTEIADNLLNGKNKILQYAIELLESNTIKHYKFEDFKTQCHFLKEENKEILENEFVKQKENEFLKTQLVNSLKNMHYQVMDDMEVIDFEKQSDFLFKVPNQSNYLNLKIGKNNSIAYNFLIEENKQELSIEQKRRKVIEMESTCDEFYDVLKNLESMGLEIDKIKSSDADIDKLLQIPKKYRAKIKEAAVERRRAKQIKTKKRYLDE
ncbi:MAG: hypothetical protein DRI95_00210 [Bacteroidetes bacterium]|nr:MAG: hypothetical protein DRI95_00210 [Bacteroidota bacterium]